MRGVSGVKALVVIVVVALGLYHLRRWRGAVKSRGVTTITTADKLRSVTHDLMLRQASLDHAITLTYAIDLGTDTTLHLAPEIVITGGPVAFDVLDRPLPLTVRGNAITFAPPPPAFGAVRQITIAFSTAAPSLKYGWGYRARPLLWATTLAPRRVAAMIQVHVPQTVSAAGWGCTYAENEGRICALSLQGRRRAVAVPMEPSNDSAWKLVFAGVLGTAISTLMYAIYRRWSVHADAMGRPEEIDPFEGVALIARGIVAVLGLIGSAFLVAHFEGGFLPLPGPMALSIWTAIAGITVVTAVGVDRPRPWIALIIITVLGTVAAIPTAAFILPGLLPLLAATLMQLTAK